MFEVHRRCTCGTPLKWQGIARQWHTALLDLSSIGAVYGSVGVVNHTHQKFPINLPRCLLKFAGLDVDIKQSLVRVRRRYQQLLPAFTKIYNGVFASSGEESEGVADEAAIAGTPVVETATSISKITSIKLPSHLPRGVIHFKIDRTNLIMAPLISLTVTYLVSVFVSTCTR